MRYPHDRPSVYFYWDDLPSRRLNPQNAGSRDRTGEGQGCSNGRRWLALNDCDYGQSHLGSEAGEEHQCGKCSGAENRNSGDESGHLNVPRVLHEDG